MYQEVKEIKEAVFATLQQFEREFQEQKIFGRKAWTTAVKQRLDVTGENIGYGSYATGLNDYTAGEFLYDLIWCKEHLDRDNPLNNLLFKVALAMECEWNMHHKAIVYDFQKLLFVDAGCKLFICEAREGDIEKLKAYFKSAVDDYLSANGEELYMYAIWEDKEGKFHYGSFHRGGEINVYSE